MCCLSAGSLRPASLTATTAVNEFPLTTAIPRETNSLLPAALRFRYAPAGAISLSSVRLVVTIGNANQADTAMTDLVNFIRFNDNNTLIGNIASVAYDLDIFGEEFDSTNAKAPVYRLFAKTPRGRRVEIGGIWKKQNQNGGDYFTLSVNTGYGKLNANLGRYPGQDDEDLMAVIPWD